MKKVLCCFVAMFCFMTFTSVYALEYTEYEAGDIVKINVSPTEKKKFIIKEACGEECDYVKAQLAIEIEGTDDEFDEIEDEWTYVKEIDWETIKVLKSTAEDADVYSSYPIIRINRYYVEDGIKEETDTDKLIYSLIDSLKKFKYVTDTEQTEQFILKQENVTGYDIVINVTDDTELYVEDGKYKLIVKSVSKSNGSNESGSTGYIYSNGKLKLDDDDDDTNLTIENNILLIYALSDLKKYNFDTFNDWFLSNVLDFPNKTYENDGFFLISINNPFTMPTNDEFSALSQGKKLILAAIVFGSSEGFELDVANGIKSYPNTENKTQEAIKNPDTGLKEYICLGLLSVSILGTIIYKKSKKLKKFPQA